MSGPRRRPVRESWFVWGPATGHVHESASRQAKSRKVEGEDEGTVGPVSRVGVRGDYVSPAWSKEGVGRGMGDGGD